MDISKLYIPNPQKWIDHYQKIGHSDHNGYMQNKNGTMRRQRGGSLNSSTSAFMQRIEDRNRKDTPISTNIDMVSPVQQTEDQAKYQIKRVVNKRKRHSSKYSPKKKHRKNHHKKRKIQRRNRKSRVFKKRIQSKPSSDIFS